MTTDLTPDPPDPAPVGTGAVDTTSDWTSWELQLASASRALHDRVVTDVVGPVVTGDSPWFFLRYWQGGPHVRVRLHGLDPAQAAAVGAGLAERLAVVGVLAEGEEPVDAAQYHLGAVRAAVGETGADAVVQPLRAPGVHPGSYEPEVERYGGPQHLAASERLFHLSSELVLAFLRHRPGAGARAALAVRATVAAATATGTSAEQALFAGYGLQALRALVEGSGHPRAQVDTWCRVSGPTDDTDLEHPALAPWHAGLVDLANAFGDTGPVHPGAVIASHVHMLHNRLGLGLVEEMRTYAWLAATSPPVPHHLPGPPPAASAGRLVGAGRVAS